MNYDIELNANDSSVLETQYVFTQGDYGQIQFSIRVKANGVYVTNAQRAYIVFTLPNGYVVTGADMTKSVATYTYPFQGSELQVPGIIIADVKLIYTDGQISSNKFSFICRYDPLHDKSFNAGPYISQLQTFIDEAQLKINYLQTLIETLQPDVGGTTLTRSDLHNTRDAVTAGLKAIDANMAQNILLKNDVTHQNENDANKIVAADSLYFIKADLQGQITALNSNLPKTHQLNYAAYESFGLEAGASKIVSSDGVIFSRSVYSTDTRCTIAIRCGNFYQEISSQSANRPAFSLPIKSGESFYYSVLEGTLASKSFAFVPYVSL